MQSEKLILAYVIVVTCCYYNPKIVMWWILWIGHQLKSIQANPHKA